MRFACKINTFLRPHKAICLFSSSKYGNLEVFYYFCPINQDKPICHESTKRPGEPVSPPQILYIIYYNRCTLCTTQPQPGTDLSQRGAGGCHPHQRLVHAPLARPLEGYLCAKQGAPQLALDTRRLLRRPHGTLCCRPSASLLRLHPALVRGPQVDTPKRHHHPRCRRLLLLADLHRHVSNY